MEPPMDDTLERRIDLAWEVALRRFFHPGTRLFYDYVTSFDPGRGLDHLPTPDEVRRCHPNVCGWGTGMEDSAINGGTSLAMICDRHAVRPHPADREQARMVFLGLRSLAEVHGVPGFVARSVCPADGRSVYPNSSRDQYTHVVHGLWHYFRSDLPEAEERADIRRILGDIARYAERCATPDHGFSLADLHGRPAVCSGLLGGHPHEAARLPMFYAAAWSVGGDGHWREACLRHLDAAIDRSLELDPAMAAYPKLQMQCSLELLLGSGICAPAQAAAIRQAMRIVAGSMAANADSASTEAGRADLGALFPDWRTRRLYESNGLMVPDVLWHEFRPTFLSVREIGEAALADLLAAHQRPHPGIAGHLATMIRDLDADRHAGYGLLYLIAAYWLGRRRALDARQRTPAAIPPRTSPCPIRP